MLNGKFYTGLTANQLSRRSASGPDRQKSHFFWPDETDTVPPSPRGSNNTSRTNRGTPSQNSSATTATPSATPDREINTKELFHKQLTSKIEFSDGLQKSSPIPNRRSVRSVMAENAASSAAKYMNNTMDRSSTATVKPNTFGSKIEFYDYDDADQSSPQTPTKRHEEYRRGDAESPHQRRNEDQRTPKSSDRRITFDGSAKRTSILKNNEARPIAVVEHAIAIEKTPEFRKNIVPPPRRINLSKSVENISKLEISPTSKIEQAVNVMTVEPKSYRDQVNSKNYYKYDDEPSSVISKVEKSRNSSVLNEYSYSDNNGTNYRHEERNEWSDGRNNHNSSYSNVEKRYSPNSTYSPHQHQSPSSAPIRNQHDNYNSGGRRYSPSKQQIYDDANRSPSKSYVRPLVIPQYPNEAATRAHSHLRSNIFFNDSSYEENQPRSVRESAVGRVGVGLPNI